MRKSDLLGSFLLSLLSSPILTSTSARYTRTHVLNPRCLSNGILVSKSTRLLNWSLNIVCFKARADER